LLHLTGPTKRHGGADMGGPHLTKAGNGKPLRTGTEIALGRASYKAPPKENVGNVASHCKYHCNTCVARSIRIIRT